MNKLKLFLTLIFISFCVSNMIAQKTDAIHSIVIYEFKGNGIIKIDRNGETNFGEKIDLKKLNKKIEKFLVSADYKKSEPHNNPPPPVSKPNEGTKNTYITIILEEDFLKDKDYANKTKYTKEYKSVEQEFTEYDILNLLSKDDKEKIIKNLQKK
ncbi:hypothetical protein [Chryseobacterium chendengshani]|uniref:hypothetical protein n=1 Tax=Chryseobacterium sp. LJ756 TaxID=2864113 RepID=UPI001C6403B8|nr:hypothetical protein [Chryseobacterium sp. LJ756]MBW7674228.1 hypothetical protein [Chryseobacterium sp. LJ756]